MVFLYFILGCIILGLFNAFVIYPILEKEAVKGVVEKIKKVIDNITKIAFWFYIVFSVLTTTISLLYREESVYGIVAIIVIIYGIYIYFKEYKEK